MPATKKFFFNLPLQDEEASSNMANRNDDELELEIEPSGISNVLEKCNDNQISLINEAYHLGCGVPKNLLGQSCDLLAISTPMGNSVLHIAAWNGNDDIVTLLIERAPKLLITVNKNEDGVLHAAARGGKFSTVKKLLEGYKNIRMQEYKSTLLNRDIDHIEKCSAFDLLEFVKLKNDQGNTMFHELMLCDKIKNGGDMIFKVCELFKTEGLPNSINEYAMKITNNANKTALYLAVENENSDAVDLILDKSRNRNA
ncbi:unnamed protein product [Lathyrus sativus]|nr:unnamed protein product [Lathyrus sativus]